MTTLPQSLLSEQQIMDIAHQCDSDVSDMSQTTAFAHALESALLATLAQGVELEPIARVFYEWPDTGPKLGWNSHAAMNAAILDESRQEVKLVPLSTAQAAVAAERVKAARTAIEMMARDGWKCVPRIMTGDMVSVWRIRSHNGGSIESCFAAAVDASTDWADWKEIRA